MEEALSSLVSSNSPRSSQDSFRSVTSQATHPPNTTSPSAKLQPADLNVIGVEQYLNDNRHLRAPPKNGQPTSTKSTRTDTGAPEPVSLPTKTSYFTTALNRECQSKGFSPTFEIEGETDFGGLLKLRDITITSDQRWPSKKEAKEGLAKEGLATVSSMEAKQKEPGELQEPGKNWIGMLLEYHNLLNPTRGPVYHDYKVGSAFASECTIPSHPEQPFGSTNDLFPSKKGARVNAAKEAVEYLIAEGELNPDGSTKSRKKVKIGAAVRIQGKGLEVKKESTFAQKVNDMCPLLGLAPLQYVLAPASINAPNMLSGYAAFTQSPSMPPKIGEVRNIFGKKNAKEEIAKGVWEILEQLARKRNVRIEEGGTLGAGLVC